MQEEKPKDLLSLLIKSLELFSVRRHGLLIGVEGVSTCPKCSKGRNALPLIDRMCGIR